ncbi:MAG: TonB-dependent receptor plug domain-containing protein [Nitrospira sp.]|nr:TonB-dependent receptor plug domain-containing protein [Nitrospira sp.]MDH4304043.1 TonB-dependent receptor plug domain-containing protein [Nitrospira sp.]MDH5193827.1 TonB-dependent receptor plug domain-containing protein [Nitrospira sp.]
MNHLADKRSSIVAHGVWLALAFCWSSVVFAHDPDEPELEVPEISVVGEKPVSASSQQFIPDKEIVLQPQGRPAQVLRLIPGFVAVEHSGGAGKADQYFLRGFDADHGTDVGFFLDGMPINLRTHAHGQGYTDLNFIIPETIEGVDVHKGAYLPEYGDFVTAGAVNFRTRDVVKEGLIQGAGGEYSTQRYLLMLSPTKDRVRTLFAAEGFYTNGPYANDNQYTRTNLLGKVTTNLTGRDELSVKATFLHSRWDGSGEIPFRAVSMGLLDRFGSINPYEGGNTLRTTGNANYHYDTTTGGQFFANAYAQYYRLDLLTDFTFFLNDPVKGDGFAQFDRRVIYGGDIGFKQRIELLGIPTVGTVGFQTRVDDAHVTLGTQTLRSPTGTTIDSDVRTVSYSPFIKAEVQPISWMRLSGGVRGEFFTFDVGNRCVLCAAQPDGRKGSGIVLPKFSMILGPWAGTEFFVNYGEGFHSNDARSAVSIGAAPLARSQNYEVGIRTRPWGPDGLELIATAWRLDLKSELVLVGDQGTTGIRGATRRQGVEIAARGKLWGPLYVNGSFTWTHAEFRNGDAIPLAPEYTAYGAAILQWPEGLTSQLQATYLGVRPLVEDRSIKSPSWITFDLSERYRIPVKLPHGRLEAFLFVQNLFNTQWEQAIFAFESRLRTEPAGVTDIHFVPGSPRTVMGGLAWYF